MLDFIFDELLSMKWLSNIISSILSFLKLDLNNRFVSSIHFFIYDTLKIIILLCFTIFIISYIQSYFPPERSKRIISKFKGIWANLISALLGTITPFCSCSSIPLFIGFTSARLPLGVTFSFLISSPMVDLGSLVLLSSVFGFKIAIAYVILGLIIAIFGGLLIDKLQMQNQVEDFIFNINQLNIEETKLSILQRISFAKEQVKDTLKKVLPYILIGVAVGSIIHNYIPQTLVTKLLGQDNPFGVIFATLIGIPMYADIFGTIPVATALLDKGATLGTILSFMMATTTLSLPSLIMLRKAIKLKLLTLFILICTIGIIIVGYTFNIFQYLFI
ncbi:MAG: permease [Anaerorhabdus sp.]